MVEEEYIQTVGVFLSDLVQQILKQPLINSEYSIRDILSSSKVEFPFPSFFLGHPLYTYITPSPSLNNYNQSLLINSLIAYNRLGNSNGKREQTQGIM